jgi:hypothetical protein
VNEVPPNVRRVTWALAAIFFLASAGAAAIAAGFLGVPSPALRLLVPSAAAASVRGAVLRPAPIVAPARKPGPATPVSAGAVQAAAVSRAYDLASSAFRPTRLVLPGGRSAPVSAVGLHDDDDSLVIPEDPQVVGWWTGGSRPGDPFGSVVVAGHVDSASRGIGVLASLAGIRAGQVVALTADGRTVRYTVVSAGLVPQAQLSRTNGLFRRDGEAQLVLITCGGAFDPVRHRYADNFVVVARPAV